MVDPVRLGLLGAGRMGSFHARALAGCEFVRVVDVFDTRRVAGESAARLLDANVHDTIEGLMRSTDAEAWLIATPTPTHSDLVSNALSNGLHVLCEKPLSLRAEDHEHLGVMATEKGLVLQVGFWRRFAAPWARARESVIEGAIGEPLMLRLAQWDANPPPPAFCDPKVSGGMAIDCGVHEYDLAEWLTGRRVERVTTRNLRLVEARLGDAGDVDNLVALLDLQGGAVATVDLTRNARYGDDVRTEILGSDGALLIESLPRGKASLATSKGISVVAGSEVDDVQLDGVVEQTRAFSLAVRGGEPELPGARESGRAVAIGRAVQEAALVDHPVSIG